MSAAPEVIAAARGEFHRLYLEPLLDNLSRVRARYGLTDGEVVSAHASALVDVLAAMMSEKAVANREAFLDDVGGKLDDALERLALVILLTEYGEAMAAVERIELEIDKINAMLETVPAQ